ncbi:DUF6438 domain-containing protein [Methylocucumis oryzae]|uniref:Lipoprotein n=1 Tax=Methylocucumis oryzae TaxID=1632867 RepID=A0A0F3IE36_9GAMM|nr:DUF6438 domain-containing protein [Methylocucumis oryzae]KJV05026.1 hypothetical protein VZ94_21105 [Methylocucumis oryzae]
MRGDARWLLRLTTLILFAFCLSACSSATSIAEEKPVLIISYGDKRNLPRQSSLPETLYQFKIYEDGLVVYIGESEVNVIGERRAKITSKQTQELITIFMKIYNDFDSHGFFGEKKHYLKREDPFLIQLDYQGKQLAFRPGGFAHYLLADLNRSIPIEDWLCPYPSFPEYDADCRSFKESVSIQGFIDKHP